MNTAKISLSAVGGGLAGFGLTFISQNFWLGLVATLVGVGVLVLTAFLIKKGFPVSKEK